MRLRRGTREFLSIGLPMLLGVVGSSLLLTHFMKGKYRLLDNKRGSVSQPQYEEMKRQHQRKPFSLEEEYEKMKQTIDLDNWSSKRVPRPPGEE